MATRRVNAAEASRILTELSESLVASDELPEAYARAIIAQAQRNAARRPTPQAPMAAAGLRFESGQILSLSGDSPPAEVAIGSEFGSGIYAQFGPRNERGYWLLPAIESPDPATIAAGEAELDNVVEDAVRRG